MFSLIFLLVTFLSFTIMADLIWQGQTYNDTATPVSYGVNVPRSTPTNFQFLNNSVTSINVQGYMIQAGDEGISANNGNLNGELIQGNLFDWKGDFAGLGTAMTITHGVFTGCNIDVNIKHNYLSRVPMGIIRKSASNMVNTSGGVSYNIVKTFNVGGVVKGMSGVKWYNNTFYQDRPTYSSTDPTAGTWRGAIDVYTNTDVSPNSAATGTKIKNNIFYSKYKTLTINVMDAPSLSGFECDYNVYWVEEGDHTPVFNAGGSTKTWDQWRALGYDAHSVVMNPNFIDFVNFVPSARLNYGTDLGTEFNTGLSTNATWVVGTPPATTVQNGTWQTGARVYGPVVVVVPPTVSSTTTVNSITQTTATSGGTITSDGGAPVTARGACWDQSGGPALDNPHTNDGTGIGTFTSNITGLSANTLYYVRSYATNSAGTGYGPRIQFTTAVIPVVVPTVTTTAITTITQTAATGGGNVTSAGGGTVTERGVCWSTSSNPTTANSKQASGSGTGVFTSAITGLTQGTVYYVRAYAINSAGTSYGSNVSFTTVAYIPVSPYYVSTSGNDATGDGTISKPWFTLNKAWTYVKAGETVYMRGGTYLYHEQQRLTGKNGTSGNTIKVLAYSGERPIISKGDPYAPPSWPSEGVVVTGNYLYVKGLDVSNFPQSTDGSWGGGMRAYNCNYSTFELLDVHHNGGGFQLTNCNQCYVINSDFHHNQDPYTTSGAGVYGNADGMGVDGTNVNAINYVRGCRFWYNTDDGIDGWAEEGTLIIENCWAFWNGFIPDTWNKGGDGSGFKLGKTDASTYTVKRKLYNNISFQNKKWGFLDNGIRCNAEVYNNTAWQNGYKGIDPWSGGFCFTTTAMKDMPFYVKNNISYANANTQADFLPVKTNIDHNTWDLPVTVTDADFVSLDVTGVTGPRQADGSLPNLNFLKLAQGSDLINKGVNVGLPFSSTAPDLGAYESNYNTVPVSPYFIAPNGSDVTGDGTIEHPWFTINKAWSYIMPGEIIYMRGGTYYYNETQNITVKSGTSGNLLKIYSYQGEKVIIRPSATYTATVGVYVRTSFLHMKGPMEICYYEQRTPTQWYNGITAYSSNDNIFDQIDVHHNGFGFSIGGTSTRNLVLNSDFHHNWDPITAIEDNRPYGGSDGLTIRVSDPSSINTVRGSRMWNNSDDGFDGWANAGMLIFEDCWSFNNGYREDGVTVGGDGNGFKMGPIVNDPFTGYEKEHKRTMIRCVAFNNREIGFVQNAAYAEMHFYNNTAFGNGVHGFVMNNPHVPEIYMIAQNNLSYKNKSGQGYFTSISKVDHNTFNYNNTVNTLYNVTDADFISLDPAGTDGPRQADGSLPKLNFLRLAQGSDLIERGIDVGLAFKGNAPDLGAFESDYVITTPNINTKPMTNVTINSATAGGVVTADGGSPITAKGVCWNTSPNPTLANSHTDEGPGAGEFTSNLTGLTPDTQYYVKAYATNAVGTSYGEETLFTTLKELFLATVTTDPVTEITINSAVCGGNVTFDGNTEVTARGICWNTTGNPTIGDNLVYSGAGVGAFISNIVGLTPNTTYYVKAFAINEVGAAYGDQAMFITLKELQLPVVVTYAVTSITQTTAVSGGNVTFDGYDNVVARGVEYSTSPDMDDKKKQ